MAKGMAGRGRIMAGILAGIATFGASACEPIATLPVTLKRGVYCLDADIGVSQEAAFTLEKDATLDCQGHRIKDLSPYTLRPVVSDGADNIEVRNCVFDGFSEVINFYRATHFRITANTFLDPSISAVVASSGNEGLISDNTFSYSRVPQPSERSDTITTSGIVDIRSNTITSTISGNGSNWKDRTGINAIVNDGGVIALNLVRGLTAGDGFSRVGIISRGHSVVYRNVISNPRMPTASYDVGLDCDSGSTIALQNIIIGHAASSVRCSGRGNVGFQAAPGHR